MLWVRRAVVVVHDAARVADGVRAVRLVAEHEGGAVAQRERAHLRLRLVEVEPHHDGGRRAC